MSHPDTPITLEALLAHREWVRALALRLVADENDANDVEQQAWLEAATRPPRHGGSPRGWLGTVVRNAARKFGRGRTRRLSHESAWRPVARVASPDELVAEAEMQQRIGRAVLELDDPYRATVLLRHFQGLAPAEVAVRMGVPVETVRTRLRRANERLRESLDAEFGGDRRAWSALLLAWRWRECDATLTGTTTAAAAAGGMAMTGTKAVVAVGVIATLVLAGLAIRHSSRSPVEEDVAGPRERETAAGPGDRVGRERSARAAREDTGAAADEPPVPDIPDLDRERDLHGIVVERDGAPIGGAALATLSYPWRALGASSGDLGRTATAGPSAVSGADGSFVLRLRRAESVSVRVSADGFATTEWPLLNAGECVRLVLDPGAGLRVFVKDARGAAVPGSRVIVRPLERASAATTVREGTTDPAGMVTLDPLPAGRSVEIAVWGPHSGSPVVRRTALPERGDATEEIALRPGRELMGRVTDAQTGAPVFGARVAARGSAEGAATADNDGAFTLHDWDGDELTVAASGYATGVVPVGDRRTVDVALARGVSLSARIVDAAGVPVARAYVTANAESGGTPTATEGHARADEVGRVRIDGLRGDVALVVCVAAAGHARLSRPVPAQGASPALDLGDIVLASPQVIGGTVLGADGRPAVGAPVSVGPADRLPWLPGESQDRRADDLGRFRFPDLAPGTYVVRSAPRRAAEAAVRVALSPGQDVTDVVLRPEESAAVRVRVVDESGSPIADMEVAAGGSQGRVQRDRTDRAGLVAFDLAREGAWVLARPDGARQSFAAPRRRTVAAWEDEVTLVLETAVQVTGRIVGSRGEAICGASVMVLADGAVTSTVQSDRDGRLTVAVPRTGAVDLLFDGRASADERAADLPLRGRLANVSAGAREFVMRCEPLAEDRSLVLRAVTPAGEPLAGAVLLVRGDGQRTVADLVTGLDGRARLDGLQDRPLWILGQEHASWIAPGRRRVTPTGTEVVMQFREAATVSGIVEYEGRPVASARVYVREGGSPIGEVVTDSEGSFLARVPCDPERDLSLVVSGRPTGGADSGRHFEGRAEDVEPGSVGVVVAVTAR